MKEIVLINLDNEMDLILAHRRSIKIAELCGLPSAAQTRFSTAVSEIARSCIAKGEHSVLALGIRSVSASQKFIVAELTDRVDLKKCSPEAYAYAARLSENLEYSHSDSGSRTVLTCRVPNPGFLSESKTASMGAYFRSEPPISPYDELRKKNIELIALSEKLAQSENRYRQLADTLPLLLCIVDDRGNVILANSWFNLQLQLSLSRFDKPSLSKIIHQDDLAGFLSEWNKAKAGRTGYQGQVRVLMNGSFQWHLVAFVPTRDGEGPVSSWIISMVDIHSQKLVEETLKDNSELKATQLELENANTELSFKNKELEQFAYVASHDLQEPLRKILVFISRAAAKMTPEQMEAYHFERISEAARRMSDLIGDVLNYSRVQSGSQGLETVDLNVVMEQATADLSLAIFERRARIDAGPLPLVDGRAVQLRQLFFNLVGNGIKFTSADPVIHIYADQVENPTVAGTLLPGSFHKITFSDNGIGIDPAYSTTIFKMFQRLHERETYSGNGIGLALCKRVVEKHGGAIDFESRQGSGTDFRIYLPLL